MSFKKIQIIWVLISLTCFSYGQSSKKNYTDADAVYLSLTKTFVLNKDGSMVTTVDKRQKLLTHRAFQSLYGETRITYNPNFQKIVVQKAFTENATHEKIETPQNGYNDILPGFGNIPKAFSHLREMVVTHTGLEQGAIINCLYEVKTEAGKIPWLMGDEMLQTECPVEKLTILVKVPAGTSLFFKSFNSTILPKIEKGKDFDSYSWQFNEVPQRNKELHASAFGDQPRLLFSTQSDQLSVLKWLTDQDAFKEPVGDVLKKYVDQKTIATTTSIQKALKIQEIVVKELNTTYIPAALLAFRNRTPTEVWQSNSGTLLEKCCLLTALLRAEGMDATIGLVLPDSYKEKNMPFLLMAEPVVELNTATEGVVLLSADHLNPDNFDLCNERQMILYGDPGKKNNTNSTRTNKIEVIGQFTLGSDGKLTADLNGIFANRFNPYFDLLRSEGSSTHLLKGYIGKSDNYTASQSKVKFSSENPVIPESKGNIRSIELPESENGISSFHLNPLPFKRGSELDLGASFTESYHYTINLPVGCRLANPVEYISAKSNLGQLTLKITQQDRTVEVTKTLEIKKPAVTREEYGDFKVMIDKWSTPKYRQVLLISE